MALFLVLNIFPFKIILPVLAMDDFSIFWITIRMYMRILLNFTFIIVKHNISTFLSNLFFLTANWSFSSLLRMITMLTFLILLGGNVHRHPGPPLSFCHWNLGGLPTDNFLKKILLQAFLCVNNFDIVIIGESHLTSKFDENEFKLDGYYFEHCDHPDDKSRGGIGVYYKTSIPCCFKPTLTKLTETLVCEVKVGTKKMFFYLSISKSFN